MAKSPARSKRLQPHELDDLFSRADHAEEAGDFKLAFRLFRAGAEEGDTRVMCRLASLYNRGQGVKKNPILARSW